MQRVSRPHGLFGSRGRAGLVSTVVPVLIGVMLAFAWTMAGSYGPEAPQAGPGLAPTVETAVDQAAGQAWASVTPTSTRIPDRPTSSPARSRGMAGTRCNRARSSRTIRAAPAVDLANASACSLPRQFPEAAKTGSAGFASTTAWSAHPQVWSLQHPGRSGVG